MQQHFELTGTGLHLPARRLTSEDIDSRCGKPEGWTRRHGGVISRHECVAPESLSTMAAEAVRQAMNEAGVGWDDVDLIIDASTSRHQPIPCNAAMLQQEFGPLAAGIPCFDVQSTCLGFIVALAVANGMMATGSVGHVLVVTSEAPLAAANWAEPESASVLGDGASAAVLRRRDRPVECFYAHQTFSEHVDACEVRGGGHSLPPWDRSVVNDAAFRFHMDGRRLLRAVRRHLPSMVHTLLDAAGADRDTLTVVPHQAAPRALVLVRDLLGFSEKQFIDYSADMGNLVAASVPAALHRCRESGSIRSGDDVLLLGTSAGYSQAGLILTM